MGVDTVEVSTGSVLKLYTPDPKKTYTVMGRINNTPSTRYFFIFCAKIQSSRACDKALPVNFYRCRTKKTLQYVLQGFHLFFVNSLEVKLHVVVLVYFVDIITFDQKDQYQVGNQENRCPNHRTTQG